MQIRDRIRELRRVKASLLRPHPKNWRIHPQTQHDAMRGILAEIGYADALLARELSDGTLELIDGHLRAETTPDMEVPVLVVDLDAQESAKLLALHDPLAALAETNREILADLLTDVETQNASLQSLLDQMLITPDPSDSSLPDEPAASEGVAIPEAYQVVVECRDEAEQKALFERLGEEGYKCRLLNL